MKIETIKLIEFLKKESIGNLIGSAVLDFTEQGLSIKVHCATIVTACGKMPKDKFQEYEALGEAGIRNFGIFRKLVERYKGSLIKIVKNETKIKLISETGSTIYVLTDKEFIENNLAEEYPLAFDEGFNIDSKKLKDIKSAGSDLGTDNIIFEVKDNKLSLQIETDEGDAVTEEVPVEYGSARAKYGSYLHNIIDSLEGNVNVSFKDNYAIQITEKTENFIVKYLLASLDEDDKKEEPKKEVEKENDTTTTTA